MRHRTGYLYKRGKVFWLEYKVEGRRICQSLGTDDRKMAEAERNRIMRPFMAADLATAHTLVEARLRTLQDEAGEAQEQSCPPLAVADAWKAYEKAKNRPDSSERTLAGYESIFRRFNAWLATTHPAKTLMRDVDAATAEGYAERLADDKVTASTFNQHIGLLRLVWRCLAEQIRGNGNPWLTIAKKRLQRLAHRRRSITPEQFNALLAAAPDADYHDLLFTLGMTGQRLVDGVMLRWDTVDFKRRVISLYPRKTARTGKAVLIPLLPALNDLLHKRRDMVSGSLVFPALSKDYTRDPSSVCKVIKAAFERAGLDTTETRPDVKRAVVQYGAHSLRHYFATQALAAGIPGEIVKRITGHTSDAMLEGYEHMDAALIGGLATRLNGAHTPATLPAAPGPGPIVDAAPIRAALSAMTAKTWRTERDRLLAVL
jgi:integrase